MYQVHDSLQSWAAAVRSGQIRLAPGQTLSHEQMAALRGYGNVTLAGEAACGAPGSRLAMDQPQAERRLTAAASALQRQRDVAAAAVVAGGTVEASIAQKLERQPGWKGMLDRIERQAQNHLLGDAPRDTAQSMGQKLAHLSLPTIAAAQQEPRENQAVRRFHRDLLDREKLRLHADDEDPGGFAERIVRQFEEAEHGDLLSAKLARLQTMVQGLIERVERYLAQRETRPDVRLVAQRRVPAA